ncbi:MAG TPA: transposase, partial [Allocoleopsis sp.]
MDIAEQIRKHLPRNPTETVPLIDDYCQCYQRLFSDVRNYEYFKYLHLGLISDIKRKSLPEISKVVNVSSQSLHHFLTSSNWSRLDLEKTRLKWILDVIGSNSIIVIIDETGDRKKGNKTDYVSRQYLGSIGKVDRGIVSVNAYGVYQKITFPLVTRIFKPK